MPMDQTIVIHSAGSMAVAAIALLFCLFQYWLFRKQPTEDWNAWGAGLSLSTFFYAAAVVVQYNVPPGALNLFCERMQYTAIVLMLHTAQGFTFSFLGIAFSPQRSWALTIIHGLALALLWATPWVIGNQFVARRFLLMDRPYHEPMLAILGPVLLAYAALVVFDILTLWIRHRRRVGGTARIFLTGIGFWVVLAIHDAAATLGVETVLFLMEYGFLGFSTAVLLAAASRAFDMEDNLILEKERMGATIRSMGEGFISTDLSGCVVMYNKEASRLCGWETKHIIGRHLHGVYRIRQPGHENQRTNLMASVMDSGGQTIYHKEVIIDPLNGNTRRLTETTAPIRDARGEITGMVILFREVV